MWNKVPHGRTFYAAKQVDAARCSNMAAESLIEAFCNEFASTPPFDRMDCARLRALALEAELGYYPAGTIISHAGREAAQMFLIRSGRVASHGADIEIADYGEMADYGKGDVFPIDALLTGQKSGVTLEALEDSFVYVLPAAAFAALRQQSAAFADYCMNRLGHLLLRSRQELQANLALDARHSALSTVLGQIMSQPIT